MMLKDETAFYKACFDSMQVGILVLTKAQKIILSNTGLETLFGYTTKEFSELALALMFKESTVFKDFIKDPYAEKFKFTLELTGIKKNGSEFPIALNFSKIEYENEAYFKAIISDISLRKKKERNIKHLNLQLEEEIKLQNKELENVIDKLKASLNKEKELNHLKTKFIALASHEFKTPLSAILSSTELIVKYADLKSVTKRNEHVAKVKSMIYHLNGMLDNLLTLENIESGKINAKFSHFKVQSLIQQISQNTNPLLKKNQDLKFNNYCVEKIYHDPHIIKIIVTNLLYNAIKYSSDKGNIYVVISSDAKNIYFTVEDDGIGIPKKEQKLIFDRFFRAKNAMYYPGTGVGLNIVKGYVNNLGGTISFESVENTGTIFNIQLPKIGDYD